ncbi:RNAse P Rpr2/Rpp21/SNM1 subunit domain-containing protein [Colletotrichum higginsianum IMI 349063]|uniref:RNAse P Rpr2/Rpp21/SNM1 subunit domain-containing protein n=1 Tax=Colletotrichum higginsianum (strain IMI 349063) TaxID=759273 RepID=A0A1B7Y2E2_COLHI|nr:RNAse P Rpr2/Rpp21/SNM1 subunit domain-containing protein [Colletotrichum higginsianum IMI 349063]OBR06164.1 RNAse P Rpr2/Rpp21/SNM1 subunit domain-containing protein [Colletotrichum higginsianum IMI 349063]
MDVSTLPIHLGYLNDAAHLLRVSAPETSAYLMSRHNELMFLNDAEQNDVRRQHVCGACGHIMIPGQGTTLKLETEKALKRKRRGNLRTRDPKATKDELRLRAGARKLFTCGHCSRTTNIPLPPPPPAVRRRTKSEQLSAAKGRQVPTAEPAKPATSNSSSKKRAKNRKAGLQALLNQAKTSSSGSRNLSLADFGRLG